MTAGEKVQVIENRLSELKQQSETIEIMEAGADCEICPTTRFDSFRINSSDLPKSYLEGKRKDFTKRIDYLEAVMDMIEEALERPAAKEIINHHKMTN